MDMWREIGTLQGHVLRTLDQHRAFDVVAVTRDSVIVRPHVHNIERPVSREEFETAFEALVKSINDFWLTKAKLPQQKILV